MFVRADADLVIWSDDDRRAVLEPFVEAFAADNGLTVADPGDQLRRAR